MSNYVPLFYMDVITYPYPDTDDNSVCKWWLFGIALNLLTLVQGGDISI